jgi:hypothetical protein
VSERNAVHQAYDAWGRAFDLEKKSGSWYGRSTEIISITNLQKSQYGLQYYVNQAFYFVSLGDERFPKEHMSHVRMRLGVVPGIDPARLVHLLDMEYSIPETERVSELRTMLDDRLSPFNERASTVDGLRALRAEGAFRAAGVTGAAVQVLDAEG